MSASAAKCVPAFDSQQFAIPGLASIEIELMVRARSRFLAVHAPMH